MRKIIATVLCLLCGGLNQAGEPKPRTEKEVEKDLAVVQSYLGRDPAKLGAELKPDEYRAAQAALNNVLKHIGGLPEGSSVRLQAIALARKYAAVTEYPDAFLLQKRLGTDDYHAYHQAEAGLNFAWGVLRKTKVLRDAMRLEEVVGLLGQPTDATSEYVVWVYRSPMRGNLSLAYWKVDRDGKRKKGSIEGAD